MSDLTGPWLERDLPTGTMLGPWRIERPLGRGGAGTVYEVMHAGTGLRAAAKVLSPQHAVDAEMKERFTREARLANLVPHPGVVRTLDAGESAGRPYFVMELVDGPSLARIWRAARRPLRLEEVAPFIGAVLDVLEVAHQRGLVHRDVKPENILLAPDDTIKLVDFGIARILNDARARGLTRPGETLGTPAFMAPEQAAGRWAEVDARTDLFAVGATAFALLANRFVHEAGTVGEMLAAATLRRAPPIASFVSDLPPAVARVIDRSLAYEREARFPSAGAMKAEWVGALTSTTTVRLTPQAVVRTLVISSYPPPVAASLPASSPPVAVPTPRPLGRLAIVAGVAAVTALVTAVATVSLAGRGSKDRTTASAPGDDDKSERERERPRLTPSATASVASPLPTGRPSTDACAADLDRAWAALDKKAGKGVRVMSLNHFGHSAFIQYLDPARPGIEVLDSYSPLSNELVQTSAQRHPSENRIPTFAVQDLTGSSLRRICADAKSRYEAEGGSKTADVSLVANRFSPGFFVALSFSSPALRATFVYDRDLRFVTMQ